MVRMMRFCSNGWVVVWNVWRRKERYTGRWLENLNGGTYLEDLGVNGSTILKWVLKK